MLCAAYQCPLINLKMGLAYGRRCMARSARAERGFDMACRHHGPSQSRCNDGRYPWSAANPLHIYRVIHHHGCSLQVLPRLSHVERSPRQSHGCSTAVLWETLRAYRKASYGGLAVTVISCKHPSHQSRSNCRATEYSDRWTFGELIHYFFGRTGSWALRLFIFINNLGGESYPKSIGTDL